MSSKSNIIVINPNFSFRTHVLNKVNTARNSVYVIKIMRYMCFKIEN